MRHGMMAITAAAALALSLALSGPAHAQAPAAADGQRRAENMKKFDKNGDGKLDETERAAMHSASKETAQARKANLEQRKAQLLKQFDQNGNGKLEPSERAAARSSVAKTRTPGAGAAQIPATPQSAQEIRQKIKSLQGQIKTEEQKLHQLNQQSERAKQRRTEALKKFDKNGDGKLDPSEREAMRSARKSSAVSKPF